MVCILVPGAFFIFKDERYKILKAEIGNGIGNPGEVIYDYLEVACGINNLLKLKKYKDKEKSPKILVNLCLVHRLKKAHYLNVQDTNY